MSAAVMLHDAGYPVRLFEQFSQPGPVGSGLMLQPTGLAVLQQLGLRDDAERLGQRIDRMSGQIAPAGKVVLDIRYSALSPQLYGVAIHRAALFDVLYQAVVTRGISITTDTYVADIGIDRQQTKGNAGQRGDRQLRLLDANGYVVAEKLTLVIDASGAQSKLLVKALRPPVRKPLDYGALWTTVKLDEGVFKLNCLEQRYQAARVMAGVLPCGRLPSVPRGAATDELATLFWSIKSSDFNRWRDNGLDQWKDEVCGHWPELEILMPQLQQSSQFTHATYSHHTLSKPYGDGIVFIGDAAHATSPQLGQGANMALLDSWSLTKAVEETDNWLETAARYAKLRRSHVQFYQWVSHALTPFYQSDSRLLPWLRDTFFEPASTLPGMASMITKLGAGMMLSPFSKLDV